MLRSIRKTAFSLDNNHFASLATNKKFMAPAPRSKSHGRVQEMATANSPEERLAALGIVLPQLPAPGGNYLSAKRVGAILYLAGVISSDVNGVITGTAGNGRSVEEGYAAARACALTQLAVIRRELGSLDHLAEVLTVNGYIHSIQCFADSPTVINVSPIY